MTGLGGLGEALDELAEYQGVAVVDPTRPPDDRSVARVLGVDAAQTIADVVLDEVNGTTVADVNPNVSPDDVPVVVAFESALTSAVGAGWREWPQGELWTARLYREVEEWGTHAALRTYTYPAGRLCPPDAAPLREVEYGATDDTPTAWGREVRAIAARTGFSDEE